MGSSRQGAEPLLDAGSSRLDIETADTNGPQALSVDRVAHRFGPRWVLRGCSLQVSPGEVIALAGRNGAGKTTLLRIVATLLRPTRGQVSVFGYHRNTDSDEIRASVGMLGHIPALYDDLTAAENLAFAWRMRGAPADPDTVSAALREVGLAAHAGDRVRGFSAGMRRRVALARILMHKPRLLLMDEPYASFDADGIELVQKVVRETTGAGGAAVIATHDLRRVEEVADRIAYMVDGLLRSEPETVDAAPSPSRATPEPTRQEK